MVEDPTGRFGPKPEPPIQLELDRSHSPPPPAAMSSQVQESFYPQLEKKRQAKARRTRRLFTGLFLALVLLGGLVVYKGYVDEENARKFAAKAMQKAKEEAELLKDMAPPKNAPACWVGDGGYMFVYVNKKGTSVVKQRIRDVPLNRRKKARCIPAQ